MLQMRPNCERCDTDLPADQAGAMICSFECTFCAPCAVVFAAICPNCRGQLLPRPSRAQSLHAQFPPSTERVVKAHD